MFLDLDKQKQETRRFLDILAEKTACKITITFLEHLGQTTKGYILNNKIPINIEDAYNLLEKEDSWYKNTEHKISVIWSFSKEDQYYNIVVVNDIKDIGSFMLNDFFLLWNSGNKFQATFLLDRYVSGEDVLKIQKALIRIYNCDNRALGATHRKNMPGFYNTKYPDYPYSKIKYVGSNVLNVNHIMEQYRKMFEKEEHQRTQQHLTSQQNLVSAEQIIRQMLNQPKKTWKDFYKEKQNENRADMAYVIYLMARGYTDEQIIQALLKESYNIEMRKKGFLDDYLKRILMVARTYYKQYGNRRYE